MNGNTLSGTPDQDDVGVHNFTLTANDNDGGSATTQFSITVNDVNDPPTFTSTPITSAVEDTPYSYTVTTNDIDTGDTVTLAGTSIPSWLNFKTTTGNLSGTPAKSHIGTHSVTITATDNGSPEETVTQTFTIEVLSKQLPAPSDVAITPANKKLLVSWKSYTEEEELLGKTVIEYKYKLKEGTNDYQDAVSVGNVNNITIPNLNNGTTYKVKIFAVDSNNIDSLEMAGVTGTPKPIYDAPSNFRVIRGYSSATLVWDTPQEPDSAFPLQYYEYSIDGGTTWLNR